MAGLGIVAVVDHLGVGNLTKRRVLVAVGQMDALAVPLVDGSGTRAKGREGNRDEGSEMHLEIGIVGRGCLSKSLRGRALVRLIYELAPPAWFSETPPGALWACLHNHPA